MELVVESGPDAGKTFQVGQTMLVAGRQLGVDILLNDDQISRRHASFEEINNVLYLNDLGSANGTRLNGRAIAANQPLTLSPGDRVQIGRTTLLVQGQPGPQNEPTITELAGAFPTQVSPTPQASYSPGASDLYPAEQPNAGYYPNQSYEAPNQPPPPPAYQAYPAQPAPQNYYANASNNNRVIDPAKKSGAGPIIAGIVGILVVAAIAIGAIFFISNNNNPGSTTPTAVAGQTPTSPSPETPGPVVPVSQTLVGPSGSNSLPPAPPANAATPTPAPTAGANPAGGTKGLGVSANFPADWKTTVDEGQNVIESDAPDGVTFSLIYRRSSYTGTPAERLTTYLDNISANTPNFQIIRPVQATSGSNTIADAYITFTDKDGTLLQRDYILATANKAGDTYFIHFATEDSNFDKQISTFNTILQSIVIN